MALSRITQKQVLARSDYKNRKARDDEAKSKMGL